MPHPNGDEVVVSNDLLLVGLRFPSDLLFVMSCRPQRLFSLAYPHELHEACGVLVGVQVPGPTSRPAFVQLNLMHYQT